MHEYILERLFTCSLAGDISPKRCKAQYKVTIMDDGFTVFELIPGTLIILGEKEGQT